MDQNNLKYNKKISKAIVALFLSPFLILIPGWLLFFKLKVIEAPGLILQFPKAYSLLIGLFISGIIFLITGIFILLNNKKNK